MAGDTEVERKDAAEIQAVSAPFDEKHGDSSRSRGSDDDEGAGLRHEEPTEEEMVTLRRISDTIPWATLTIAFVELCERFSYYGTTAVCTFSSFFSPVCFAAKLLALLCSG